MNKRTKKARQRRRKKNAAAAQAETRTNLNGDAKIFIAVAATFLVLAGLGLAKLKPQKKILLSAPEFSEFNAPGTPPQPVQPAPGEPPPVPPQAPAQNPQTFPPTPSGAIPVLMYHHVGDLPVAPDAIRRDLTVSTADFRREVELVDRLGYHAITAADLDGYMQGREQLPQKPILFTFDDGYDDVFQNAVPILTEHHMTGSFAIITGFVGQSGYAGWDSLAAARDSGMELVCHSEHHMDFTNRAYTPELKNAEVADCKKDLQDHLGIDSKIFVYPYGHFDAAIEQILRNNGFDLAFTTQFGLVRKGEAELVLPRVRVHGVENIETFQRNLGVRTFAAVTAK